LRTIAVLNQKGGVGKTTTVANISAALAGMGQRVAVVDLDPQAHLTIHLGIDSEQNGTGSYGVLCRGAGFTESLEKVRDNLWLLGANIDLIGAESELVSIVGREIILGEAIATVKDDYDYLIIDCPPSLGLLTLNALAAVEEVFIPIQPHFLALQGFGKLLETITLVSRRINPKLKVGGILLCMFDSRVILSAEVKADIEKFLTNARSSDRPWAQCQMIPVHIRRNIKLAEAPRYGKTIFEYEPKCHGADDYYKVAEFIHAMSRDTVDNTVEVVETTKVTSKQRIVDIPQPSQQPADTEPVTKDSLT
jgi:chromosome partitioning protein